MKCGGERLAYTGRVLSSLFVLSGLAYLALGAVLYFLPPGGLLGLTLATLWVARFAGAVVLAWGAQLLASAPKPLGASVAGLVVGNLLVAAVLAPAALRGVTALAGVRPDLVLGGALFLALLAVLALLAPRQRSRL